MLQLRPTFSESWYRVAKLKVRLRPTAQVSRQYYRGDRWYVVRDPAGNQFHRLSDPAYRFIGLLDGSRTVEEAWNLAGGQLADDAPTQPEVIQILSQLYAANLVETDVSPDAQVLLRRHKSFLKRRFQSRLMNVLFPRIPLWDCDAFLVRWMPVVRPMLSKVGALIWILVVGLAIAMVLPHWDALKRGASDSIAPGNWGWLWLTFVGIKLIHELGHAFGCRRFGGEVHELGIMFLVLVPTPYVDASTAWSFPSKWQKMFVGAAGMIVELFFAALCAFVWLNTTEGRLIHQLAYNAMLIASVSTVIFNANPLLRYDGYYILSDFLEIPNLRQKSSEYALGLIKRHVFRVKSQQPLPPVVQRFWLFTYAVTSSVYRVLVGVTIILLVAFQVPVLGVLMALGGVATWLLVPVFKTVKYLALEPELHRKRGRATAFVVACAAAIAVVIGVIPFWFNVRASGIVEPAQRENLFTTVPGWVDGDITVKDGQPVEKGQVILTLTDPELDAEIARVRAELKSETVRRDASKAADDPAEANIAQDRIDASTARLDDLLRRKSELTLRAPIAGRLISPNIEELAGRYIPRGQQIATVATLDKLLVRAVISQDEAQLINKEEPKKTEIRLAGDITGHFHDGKPLSAPTIERISAAQPRVPHAALTHGGGGDYQPDPRDPHGTKTLTEQFEVRITLPNPTTPDHPHGVYLPGQVAHIQLGLARRPLIWQWTRRFWQIIQTHSGSSEWL